MPITTAIFHNGRPETLDGARLLVLLHGYMSNELDLLGLAPRLPEGLVVVSLRAPIAAGPGYAWFTITEPGNPTASAVDAPALAILKWLDDLQAELGVPAATVLLGFSQGGALVTHVMRHAPERFAAGLVLSGFATDGELPGDAVLAFTRPPVFWGRDDAEQVISRAAVSRTTAWLPEHSTLTERLYPGMGHSVSLAELDDINQFLEAVLA